MDKTKEQRKEQRLYYNWPVRFTGSFGEPIFQGRMVDLTSRGAAFTCRADENCPYPGQQITILLSVPRHNSHRVNLIRIARICRANGQNRFTRRVAVQFNEPLPFKPLEIANSQSHASQKLQNLTVGSAQPLSGEPGQ